MLAQHWPYVVYPKPTISQRSNGLPTLAQRSHAIWDSLLLINKQKKKHLQDGIIHIYRIKSRFLYCCIADETDAMLEDLITFRKKYGRKTDGNYLKIII